MIGPQGWRLALRGGGDRLSSQAGHHALARTCFTRKELSAFRAAADRLLALRPDLEKEVRGLEIPDRG